MNKVFSEVKFEERKSVLQQKEKTHKRILPFVTQYHPAVPNSKNMLISKWHLIQGKYTKSLPLSRTKEESCSKIFSFDPGGRLYRLRIHIYAEQK